MKSEGVRDVFLWLKQKCKEQKKIVDEADELLHSDKAWAYFDDERCIIDRAERDLALAKERLQAFVDIKVSVEKYMKKLKHQGE